MAITQEPVVGITAEAAAKVKDLLAQEPEGTHLRLFVTRGGCSGYTYGMTLDNELREGDQLVDQHGVGRSVGGGPGPPAARRASRLYEVGDGRGLHAAQPQRRPHLRLRPLLYHRRGSGRGRPLRRGASTRGASPRGAGIGGQSAWGRVGSLGRRVQRNW